MTVPDKALSAIFTDFVDGLHGYTVLTVERITPSISPFIRAVVILYCVYIGFNLIRGKFDRKHELLASIILIVVLHTFLIESTLYLSVLTQYKNFIMSTAGFFIGGSSSTVESLFSGFGEIIQGFQALTDPPGDQGFLDILKLIPLWALSFIVFLVIIGAFVIYLVLCLLAMFGIYFLFLIGAVPIFLSSFRETRHIFYTWLRAILCDSLIIIFASILISVCVGVFKNTLNEFAVAINNKQALFAIDDSFALIVTALITCGLLLKAPDYASNLTGSSAGSSSHISGGVAIATGKILKSLYGKSGKARNMGSETFKKFLKG